MDRFIALQTLIDIQQYFCLKSNMDRFIGYWLKQADTFDNV